MIEKKKILLAPAADRGSFSSLGSLLEKIPASSLGIGGWCLAELFIFLLLAEMAANLCGIVAVYIVGFSVLGTAVELLAMVWIAKILLDRSRCPRMRWSFTDAALLAMLIWCALSTACSPDPAKAFLGSSYRQEGMSTYLIYGALFICCRRIDGENLTRWILWSLVLAAGALSIGGLLCLSPLKEALSRCLGETVVRDFALDAVFSNTNHFAYFLVMSTMAAAGLFLTESKSCFRWLALVIYCTGILMLHQNGTLGAQLALYAGLIFWLVCSMVRKDGCAGKIAGLGMLLILLTLLSTRLGRNAISDMQTAVSDLAQAGTVETSNTIRFQMWETALEYIRERPLLGFGPDGSGLVSFRDIAEENDRAHNEYLQYAVHFGIPGGLMYLTALISLFIRCSRRLRKLPTTALILGGMVFSYCASAFVGNSMYYTTVYFVIILALLTNESVKESMDDIR